MRGNAGFTIVAELVAAGLLLLSVLALVGVTTVAYREFHNYHIQTAIIDQESLIVSALQSEVSLTDLRKDLLSGSMPAGRALLFNGKPVAQQGVSWFTFDHVPCSAGSSPDCDLKVALNIQCTASDGCLAGYRISSASGNFALGGSDDTLPAADLTVPIPFEIWSRTKNLTDGSDTLDCASSTDLFARGYNKLTGELICAKRPLGFACGANLIAQEIYFDLSDYTVKPRCVPVKTAKCPAKYSLQSIVPSSLAPDSSAVLGSCIFTTADSAPVTSQPADGPVVSGNFCPSPDYTLTQFSCSINLLQSTPGQNCSWAPNYPPNPGSVATTSSGGTGTCTMTYQSQGCGAIWRGLAHVNGGAVCTLTTPPQAGVE